MRSKNKVCQQAIPGKIKSLESFLYATSMQKQKHDKVWMPVE